MSYVINSLKAEILSLKGYIKYCQDRQSAYTSDDPTQKKLEKEIKNSRKNIQLFRDAINLLSEYKKAKR